MNDKYTDPLQLYDRSFTLKRVIDIYDSFVWTDVYCGYGDFELKIPDVIAKSYNITEGDFLECPLSDSIMVVEGMSQSYDANNAVTVTYKGRSIESILCRRVLRKEDVPDIVPQYDDQNDCYVPAVIRGLWDSIEYVLLRTIVQNDNISLITRGIDALGYTEVTDTNITDQNAPYANLDGMTVYDYVLSELSYYGFGFRIKFYPTGEISGDTITDRILRFEVYNGVNRSHTQKVNPRVIFSPDDDSTYKMDTSIDISGIANAALILGPNIPIKITDSNGDPQIIDTEERYTTELYSGVSGFDRYETFVDASSISAKDAFTNQIWDPAYIIAQMRFQAIKTIKSKLSGNISYNPSIDFDPYKVYGEDYNLGDICTVIDDFGNVSIARIGGFTQSVDNSGYKKYPNFESIPPIGGYRAIEQFRNGDDVIRETEEDGQHGNALRVTEHNNIDLFDNTEVGDDV